MKNTPNPNPSDNKPRFSMPVLPQGVAPIDVVKGMLQGGAKLPTQGIDFSKLPFVVPSPVAHVRRQVQQQLQPGSWISNVMPMHQTPSQVMHSMRKKAQEFQPGSYFPSNVVDFVGSTSSQVHEKIVQLRKNGREFGEQASQELDRRVQSVGHQGTRKLRDMVKLKEDPNDWFWKRGRNKAINFGIDVVADNADRIISTAKGFGKVVVGRIPGDTWDRVTPSNLLPLHQNPELAKLYFKQRWEQIKTPVDFYNDPKGFMKKKGPEMYRGMQNYGAVMGQLEGGLMGKTMHGGRAIVDYAQGWMAPVIGTMLGTMAIYNQKSPRQKTNAKFDQLLPKDTWRGAFTRLQPWKTLVFKPPVRVMGNPLLSFGVLGYLAATGVGKKISEYKELQQSKPDVSKRLEQNNRHIVSSGRFLDMFKSVESTKPRPTGTQKKV